MAFAVVSDPKAIIAAGTAVANVGRQKLMLGGQLADMVAKRVHPAVLGAVNESGSAEISCPEPFIDDEIGDGDHRRDADAGGEQNDRAAARLVEDEFSARRHCFQAKAGFDLIVEEVGNQCVATLALDREPVVAGVGGVRHGISPCYRDFFAGDRQADWQKLTRFVAGQCFAVRATQIE